MGIVRLPDGYSASELPLNERAAESFTDQHARSSSVPPANGVWVQVHPPLGAATSRRVGRQEDTSCVVDEEPRTDVSKPPADLNAGQRYGPQENNEAHGHGASQLG